ncbi:5-formyltetrahydrofolate cyclo-ligase [Luteolibacter pohnpeiensis]|uniref:5-formyltetrahydrofolate cyclo-ligase n=1 Tax=Luteolibacter pohnpeiensis TaxID=454153 RepID=A0A934S9V0_9BACT|nr:5-formyltetrahydrofolate cyclo-ligase [Luteolibacter pohnpeiensis]MBK1884488.1 5-formyltetrahydrofolate cyclo-ligase [Luteolibacter pohnpeiensis]
MTPSSPPTCKADLRRTMRSLLKSASFHDEPVAKKITHWISDHPELITIAMYAALPGEIDILELISPGKSWALPRVEGEKLVFHEVRSPDTDLKTGAFGIREPLETLPIIPADKIDAFFCPGLAFDARGGRLGRGRGFYDRLLENARPDALKIGICHPFQLVPDVFAEAHDIRMDGIIC